MRIFGFIRFCGNVVGVEGDKGLEFIVIRFVDKGFLFIFFEF